MLSILLVIITHFLIICTLVCNARVKGIRSAGAVVGDACRLAVKCGLLGSAATRLYVCCNVRAVQPAALLESTFSFSARSHSTCA